MTSRKTLLAEFDRMDAERTAVVESLRAFSTDMLEQKPAPDAWSVAQVVQHLVVAETGALRYMQKKLEFGGHSKASFVARVRQWLLNTAIMLPVRYKAPRIIVLDESTTMSFEDAVSAWEEVRRALRNEYQAIDGSIIDHELFKHPAAGKLSLIQSVRFMRQHMLRHIKQMNRNVSRLS